MSKGTVPAMPQGGDVRGLPVSGIREVGDALLAPRDDRWPTGKRAEAAGVFGPDHSPVPGAELATFRWRAAAPEGFAETARDGAAHLPGRWLFGGLCRPHFGHVITNSLGRIWAVDNAGPIDGIAFIGDKARAGENAYVAAFLDTLGVTLPHRVCFAPTVVERLVVAPDLFSEAREGRADPAYSDWIRARLPAPAETGGRIYVTRTRLGPEMGRVLCEDVIEENLRAAGYDIVAPETLPLAEQVALYRRADRIVATDGSALHLAAFATAGTVTVIQRRPDLPRDFENHLRGALGDRYQGIDAIRAVWFRDDGSRRRMPFAMAELDFDALRAGLVAAGALPGTAPWRVPGATEVEASRAWGSPPGTAFAIGRHEGRGATATGRRDEGDRAMDDHQTTGNATGPDLPVMDGIRYLRMLSRLHETLAPDWYLEIGTNKGRSLARANCNFVAVDPNFILAEPLRHEAAREMHLIQKTSDDFFASGFCERNGLRFDLAFLDGLHHYEVLLRDVINAEKLMKPGAPMLLHDPCPSSVEMTAREQCRGNWTGDVWKTVLILLEHRPDLRIEVATAAPTGVVVIRGLDPGSTVLEQAYDAIVSEWDARGLDDIGGLAGYYERLNLLTPEQVLETIAA
ncbi:DUF563 domain-containing protein [Rhodobacterales bacterium HKCCE2091]|nr:DUF563 domain-containing protein [Rhodobacterales bacterium HKCCE2091]